MALRPPVPAVAMALLLTPVLAAPGAEASTVLGSTAPAGPADGFACEGCVGGTTVGLRQFALRGATVEAPEDGVLVSAGAHLRRIAGAQQPRIAVLRPAGGIQVTIAATASLPASSQDGMLEQVGGLHLPVLPGDSLGLLLPAGEVDLGVRRLPSPDGAVVSFALPCAPCGIDGGTGRELLFQGTVEPDADQDLLGDESQDPDGGFPGDDEGPPGDEELVDEELLDDEPLDEELGFDDELRPDGRGRRRDRVQLRLLRVRAGQEGGATLLLATSGPGRLRAVAKARVRPIVIATGRARATRAGRVRLQVRPGRIGGRLIARRGRVRTRLEVRFHPRRGRAAVVSRALTLRMPASGR